MSIIKDRVVLITGADGGIGSFFIDECLQRGVKKIYATGIDLASLEEIAQKSDRIVPIELDVTSSTNVYKCQLQCSDVDFLLNNAGVEQHCSVIGDDLEKVYHSALLEMNVNYFGVLNMCNAFLPQLLKHEHAIILNNLSLGSLVMVNSIGTYCASKAATHYFTESLRDMYKEESITNSAIYAGYVNTKMTEGLDVDKASPLIVVRNILDAIETGKTHIFPDPMSQDMLSELTYQLPIIR